MNLGRILEGRRFSDGLHQAIEAKENVKFKRKIKHWRQLHIKIFLDYIKNLQV